MNIEAKTISDNDSVIVEPRFAPAYHIHVERGWQKYVAEKIFEKKERLVFFISEKGLKEFLLNTFIDFLKKAAPGQFSAGNLILLEGGEKNKSLFRLGEVYDRLIDLGADRQSLLIAIGGGVIGDFVGFIAATLYRGIDFMQIPTTLLAAVDATVGGKTAVNIGRGKNMVGAFHQPRLVYFNIELLETLPAAEWNSGLAEMAKHAFLEKSGTLYKLMIENIADMRRPGSAALKKAVLESIAVKAAVVDRDEKEKGLRAVLNLGHTVAHAIESATDYKGFSHGEAVSRGLITIAILSRQKGLLSEKDETFLIELLQKLSLPLDTADLKAEVLYDHMKYDKKNVGGVTQFVLLAGRGDIKIGQRVTRNEFNKAWNEQRERFGGGKK